MSVTDSLGPYVDLFEKPHPRDEVAGVATIPHKTSQPGFAKDTTNCKNCADKYVFRNAEIYQCV
ncbi:hypothetical protein ABBQ32_003185 [Trebouxia sp. C0010 RCD-2024]